MSHDARAQLGRMIRELAFQHRPERPFRLASGAESPFYFNCKAVTLRGRGINLVGQVLFEEMRAFPDARAVGGLTLGADPLAVALAGHATARGRELDAIIIRKEPKGHGTRSWVEGLHEPGLPVVILDDVVTTGGSTITAIERASESGLSVQGALLLVDRQEFDGMERIREALRKVGSKGEARAVFRAEEFLSSE